MIEEVFEEVYKNYIRPTSQAYIADRFSLKALD